MSKTITPDFGENGAVLNSPTMTDDLRDDYRDPSRVYPQYSLRWEAWIWPLTAPIWIFLAVQAYQRGASPFDMGVTILVAIVWTGRGIYSIRQYRKAKSALRLK
jgi:hypothetical protein